MNDSRGVSSMVHLAKRFPPVFGDLETRIPDPKIEKLP